MKDKKWLQLLSVLMLGVMLLGFQVNGEEKGKDTMITLVIHGGAGAINRDQITPEQEKEYRDKLKEALITGYGILQQGGDSLSAVEAAIRILEDSPLFNAGKGAVFTAEGTNELDASIMEGAERRAGAVAAVKHVKNPISLARLVMEQSPHVLLSGEGAEHFAQEKGMELVNQKYFFTEKRWENLQEAKKAAEEKENSEREKPGKEKSHKENPAKKDQEKKTTDKNSTIGTVGAVALDKAGNLAAGTSTGGMTYKKYGRVGDSPLIGAGTFADNHTCAVSGTGWGEYFIRSVLAYDIAALMEYKGLSLEQAAQEAITKMGKMGGFGGVIALDRQGNIAMPFNTNGMYRGYINSKGNIEIQIFSDQEDRKTQ